MPEHKDAGGPSRTARSASAKHLAGPPQDKALRVAPATKSISPKRSGGTGAA